jgi:glucose dehydrogenase
VTGELAWAWDMGAPERSGALPEGEVHTRGTLNMWTIASGDEALGLVYLPLGNSAVDFWGGNRSDIENAYATSLVADLPGGGQTTPITYEVDGRQYVVIAPGGHHFMETPISDAIIAYALPEG